MLALSSPCAIGLTMPFAAVRAPVRAPVATMAAKSQALPFLDQPTGLTGTMAGDVGFDPLGLSSSGVPMAWMREAEIKHGRVCMLAIVGYIAVDVGLRAPGAPAISSFAAHDATVASGHMWALLGAAGLVEIAGVAGIAATMNGSGREPGDFAFDGGFAKDATKLERFKLSEIKHSRLAMMAFSGLVTQDALAHGTGFPYL